MPFRPEHSLLRVEVPALHTIDTSSVENLHGIWSLFSKTSHACEYGKRLENLSWRLWNRETFCCTPSKQPATSVATAACAIPNSRPPTTQSVSSTDIPVPELSSSLDSASSDDEIDDPEYSENTSIPRARPELRRHLSITDNSPRGKHITPIDLEKIVISMKETKLEPIELPLSMCKSQAFAETPLPSESNTPHCSASQATLLESSASTVNTNDSNKSETIGSPDSSSTEMSGHSIIRGFVPGGLPSSYRSQTNLTIPAQPTPILKTSPQYHATQPKKKGAMFTIGTSSGEEESSLDSHMRLGSVPKSELSESLRRSAGNNVLKKTTSFKDEVANHRTLRHHSPVFESDDEDEDVSESAIEDDDDSSEWEDSDDNNSGPSSVNDTLFQRVDSRPNLTSRRSLLTTLMHEPDRAKALANAASRSSPAMRRSRVTSPNGPSLATTPENPALASEGTQPQPIIMTTSNMHQLAHSPRTTRRNMLSTELTESLRKNLLWERQHKSTGNLAALKRRHTAVDMKNLKEHPQPTYPTKTGSVANFTNDYFDAGLGDIHARGW